MEENQNPVELKEKVVSISRVAKVAFFSSLLTYFVLF